MPLAELDLEAAAFFAPPDEPDLLAPPVEPDFEAADFLAPPVDDFEAPLDFLAVEPDFELEPPDDFLAVELFAAPDLAVEDFFAEPVDLEEAEPDLELEAFVPEALRVDDFVPEALRVDDLVPVAAFCPAIVAASPSATMASPAPCRAPAAAPAAAFATTSPAPFAAEERTSPAPDAAVESTSPAASFAFCTNPLELDFDDLFVAIFIPPFAKIQVCMRAIHYPAILQRLCHQHLVAANYAALELAMRVGYLPVQHAVHDAAESIPMDSSIPSCERYPRLSASM